MAGNEGSWHTQAFRQSIVEIIEEAIQKCKDPTTKNSIEMENHVFQNANSKDEYIGLVTKLILHVSVSWK